MWCRDTGRGKCGEVRKSFWKSRNRKIKNRMRMKQKQQKMGNKKGNKKKNKVSIDESIVGLIIVDGWQTEG